MGSCLVFLSSCGEKAQIKSSVNGLDVLIEAFHLNPRQRHFPGAQPMTREGSEGNATIPEEEDAALCGYIRLTGEKIRQFDPWGFPNFHPKPSNHILSFNIMENR